MHRSAVRRWTLGVSLPALMLLAIALAPLRAEAHAQVVSSTPADGSTVTTGLTTVVLTFSEEVSPEQSDARLADANGHVLSTVTSTVRPDKRTEMVINTPPLPEGRYTVTWHAVTEDDNGITDGTVRFQVSASGSPQAGATTAAQAAASSQPPASGGSLAWLWLVLGAVVIVVVAAIIAYRQRILLRS